MRLRSVVLAAALVAWAGPALAQRLRSPWPETPPVPGLPCPAPPHLPASLDVSGYYTDPASSEVDPDRLAAYQAGVRPLHDATLALELLADNGNNSCALSWLRSFAADQALTGAMATDQAEYVRGWMLGAWAVVALKSAPPGGVPSPVGSWLARLGTEVRATFNPRVNRVDGRNNHRNWAGFAVAASGIAADQVDLWAWGLDSARAGLEQVTPDGTLPLEMARRSRALHYHLFATAPLVLLAELAAANGVDLYAAPDASGQPGALRRLGVRVLSGVADPAFFAAQAGMPQVDAGGDSPGNVAWASTFLVRQPGAAPRPPAAGRSDLYSGGRPPE